MNIAVVDDEEVIRQQIFIRTKNQRTMDFKVKGQGIHPVRDDEK